MIPKVEPLIQSLNEMSSSYFLAESQMSATAMVSIPSQITATLTMLLEEHLPTDNTIRCSIPYYRIGRTILFYCCYNYDVTGSRNYTEGRSPGSYTTLFTSEICGVKGLSYNPKF